jgi:Fe-S-cluster-containing dehydrogenase component
MKPEDGNSISNPLCTRRQTLIWGGVSIIGLSTVAPVLAQGTDKPLIIMEKARGLVIADPVLCVGCGRCELACTEFNDGKASPSLSRIKIDRNLNFGRQGIPAWRVGHGNMGDGLILQDLCMQCPHPVPCADICPENAIVLSPATNARMVDTKKCTGCMICLRACPWEMISFDPDSRKAAKCHLCQGKPKCVEACPAGSLSYVPWNDLTASTPQRNLNAAMIPPQRSVSCQQCHLPGQPQNLRALLREKFGKGSGYKLIDMAGAILIPLAIGSVLVHAVLRKVTKR